MTSLQRAFAGNMLGTSIGKTRSRSEKSQTNGARSPKLSQDIEKKIRDDVAKLKNRDHGIREILLQEYGLAGREAENVSIDARGGGEEDARQTLRAAWINKNSPS